MGFNCLFLVFRNMIGFLVCWFCVLQTREWTPWKVAELRHLANTLAKRTTCEQGALVLGWTDGWGWKSRSVWELCGGEDCRALWGTHTCAHKRACIKRSPCSPETHWENHYCVQLDKEMPALFLHSPPSPNTWKVLEPLSQI